MKRVTVEQPGDPMRLLEIMLEQVPPADRMEATLAALQTLVQYSRRQG